MKTENPTPPPKWLNGHLWKNVGYVLSAIWMIGVLIITGSDTKHPLFQYIFLVPLAGWVLGLMAGAILKKKYSAKAD